MVLNTRRLKKIYDRFDWDVQKIKPRGQEISFNIPNEEYLSTVNFKSCINHFKFCKKNVI